MLNFAPRVAAFTTGALAAEGMESWFTAQGAQLKEVGSLDLEDVFVELLRWARFDRRSA